MNRLDKIAAKLTPLGLDALLVTSAPGESYAVGFHGEGVVLVLPNRSFYMTDSRYIEVAQSVVTGAEVAQLAPERGYRGMLRDLIERHGVQTLGFEDEYMTVHTLGVYQKDLPCKLVPAQAVLTELRASKDAFEIEQITKAQRIAERALDECLGYLKPGMTERDVAARLVYDMLRFGADKVSFDPIAVSGPNSSLPHGVPGGRAIVAGDFLTLDFGCMVGGYCSDMTRTLAIGTATDEMRKVYATVLEAQLAGIAAARAGVSGIAIDAAARNVIEQAGYGSYFGHGFGHSVGLEIHEAPNASPRSPAILPAGAVLTAEPGIYLPGRFGVRIEDMLVLRDGFCENLTNASKELIIL